MRRLERMFELLEFCQGNRSLTRRDITLRGIRVVVDRKHFNRVMAREGGRSDEANQVHWDKLLGVVKGHVLGIVYEEASELRIKAVALQRA